MNTQNRSPAANDRELETADLKVIHKDLEALNMIIRENDLAPEQEAKSPTRIVKKKRLDDKRANSAISVIEIAPHPTTSRKN